MDTLIIKNLTVATQIGVYAWEQRIKQNVSIDISIVTDFSACKDDLANTIDYDALCKAVTKCVESQPFQLIETVANTVASLIKEQFNVTKLTVAVSKPHAIANAGTIQVITEN